MLFRQPQPRTFVSFSLLLLFYLILSIYHPIESPVPDKNKKKNNKMENKNNKNKKQQKTCIYLCTFSTGRPVYAPPFPVSRFPLPVS